MIYNHFFGSREGDGTLCGVTLAERNRPRFMTRDPKKVNCRNCRRLLAQKEPTVAYVVQIEERGKGREILKFLEPERNRILADLDTAKKRMVEMMDGRDLRQNYAEIIKTAKWIVRLQKAADILGGYEVDLDAGHEKPPERS